MNETQMHQDNNAYGQIGSRYGGEDSIDNSRDDQEEESFDGVKKIRPPISFWITSLKILSSIVFIGIVVFGLMKGIGIFLNGNELAGLLVFLLFSLSAFMGLSLVMVLLNLSQDTMVMRFILEMILANDNQRRH